MTVFSSGHWGGRRLGVLGGTFDPVHNGHLAVAEYVQETLALDGILFVPSALPPHKTAETPFSKRLTMLKLAVEGHPSWQVSDLEARRAGPSYSVDTLRALSVRRGDQAPCLFFIIGIDAFLEITSWKAYSSLGRLASFVVIRRPGYSSAGLVRVIAGMGDYLFEQERGHWRLSDEDDRIICLLDMAPVGVSSTLVRALAAEKQALEQVVPGAVARYIKTNGLYG